MFLGSEAFVSDSFTNLLNRLLVHVLHFCALVDSPAQRNPHLPSLHAMNPVNVEVASTSFTPPVRTQALPELLFRVPVALTGKAKLLQRAGTTAFLLLSCIISGDSQPL